MIQKKPLIILASVASAMLMSACVSNVAPKTTVVTTDAATTAAEVESAEPSEPATAEYTLTEEAKKELENVFKDCFYFEIGHNETQLFANFSAEDTAKVMCTTFLSSDSYLKKGVYDEGTGYVVSRDELSEYMKDGFGLDLDNFDFSDENGMLKDQGDTFCFLGGDYGMGVPDAIISDATEDQETGLITVTGDALFISEDDGEINPYLFTATMQPSESKYFGGNTLISFEYEENTTGVYPDVKAEDYGLDSIHFEEKA